MNKGRFGALVALLAMAASPALALTGSTNGAVSVQNGAVNFTGLEKVWLPAAGCNNTTPATFWDLPTASPAVATCVTGTNTQKGVLTYNEASNLSAQTTIALPADWTTTGGVDATIYYTASTNTGNVVFQLSNACAAVAGANTDDPTLSNTDSTTATAVPGTAGFVGTITKTGLTMSGCSSGTRYLWHLKVARDGANGSDTTGANINVIGVEITFRRAQ